MISIPPAPHRLTIQETQEILQTSMSGLSDHEVAERLKKFGKNEIPDPKKKPAWKILLKQFKHLMVYILILAALISYLTGHHIDVYVILAIVVINAVIGFVQEYKAEGAVEALKSLLVPRCKVIRNGKLLTIDSKDLVPGDLLALEEGDLIPADARIVEQKNARSMEASLTGEAVPVEKHTAPIDENTAVAERANMTWKSTFLASGSMKAWVTGTGLNTQIGEIAATLKTLTPQKTNFQIKSDKLAQQMAIIAILSAVLLFLVGYFLQEADISEVLLISIAALVSAIPEGLPAVLSIVLAIGSYRMSRKNAIIREFSATESLGSVSTIVTDKTGTLTQNTMTIKKVWGAPGKEVVVTGEGWDHRGELIGSGEDLESLKDLLVIAAHSHKSSVHRDESGKYKVTGDPTEAAFSVLAKKGNTERNLKIVDDFAFSSELKYRATIIEWNGRLMKVYIGAPESILGRTSFIKKRCGETGAIGEEDLAIIEKHLRDWSHESLRVLALALKTLENQEEPDSDLVFIGLAGMMDPPRPGVKKAVEDCHRAGIRVIMATGDHAATALAIGKEVGIVQPGREKVYTDSELQAMDPSTFDKAVLEADVFSRLTPLMKLKIAESLQKNGELVAMTGDGVNDAPALKQANVGVSMGIMGTDVARDASMMVLADDNFATIVNAVEQGRIVFNNARRTSFFLVTTNFAEITTLILAVGMGYPMPLTATQILWINLVTDGFCDKALATEKGQGNELLLPPVTPKENILNKNIVPFLVINAFFMTALAIGAFVYYLPEGLEKARTIVFIVLAFTQLFNVLNMRNLRGSSFKIGLFSNNWVNYALLVSVVIQVLIIEVPAMAELFDFQPVLAMEFLFWVFLSSFVFWIAELYKLIFLKK
ncbi:cation-translocating P-type ATPase [Negadavirga shengliensis]|uniref:Cation-translocating P-type ATPase n=1 Tax=Negadavirga shengliensis TaxID=1389218 RepID=A0ABV9T345_9BACT